MLDVVALIPAYEPENTLVALIERLSSELRAVVVVDDGSQKAGGIFASLPRAESVIQLTHPRNRGKGAALKTGLSGILRRFPDTLGVVTVDADGQHLPEDILRVARALTESPDRLILGVRTFAAGTPFRSRLGNLWTCGEFFLLTGHRVRDTQTGLRGLPSALLPRLLELPGERYEYEIRMLVDCVRHLAAPVQIPITTVYADGNATSHFRPLADTFRTQRALFAAVLRTLFQKPAPQR